MDNAIQRQLDEVEALKVMYPQPGEVVVYKLSENFTVEVKFIEDDFQKDGELIKLRFEVPFDYPV